MKQTTSQSPRSRLLFPVFLLVMLLLGLFFPLSNFFLKRKSLDYVVKDPDFIAFSQVMQTSCVDCHSTNMIAYPVYAQLTPAKKVIAHDIVEAQSRLILTESQLTGASPIAGSDLSAIAVEINEGSMPPQRYKALHWNAALSADQQKAVIRYVRKTSDASIK